MKFKLDGMTAEVLQEDYDKVLHITSILVCDLELPSRLPFEIAVKHRSHLQSAQISGFAVNVNTATDKINAAICEAINVRLGGNNAE